jgi:hypothetical protein
MDGVPWKAATTAWGYEHDEPPHGVYDRKKLNHYRYLSIGRASGRLESCQSTIGCMMH